MNRQLAIVCCVTALATAACASSKPDPADVTAARGCEALVRVTADMSAHRDDTADSADLVAQANAMTAGTVEAHDNGTAEPKWAKLGADLVTFVADMHSQASASKLNDDVSPILTACGSIPGAAKRAGGYVRK